MSVYKAGLGWAGAEDYATPALCVTDRAGVDTDDIIILCRGYLGRNNVITGFHPFNILIYSEGVLYDGSNSDDLAYFSGVLVDTASPLTLRNFSSNNDGNGYDTPLTLGLNALNATIEDFHTIRTKLIAHYPTARIDSNSLTNTVRRGIVDANNMGTGLDHKYDDKCNLSAITELNSLNKGITGSSKASCSDSLSVNNTGDDFAAFSSITNCASEDLTGNITGYSLGDMVNPANKNYQVKAISSAHALKIGAFFEASAVAPINLSRTIVQQFNKGINGQLNQVHNLAVSAARQFNKALTGNIQQTHDLLLSSAQQVHKSNVGEVSQIHLLGLAIAQQVNKATRPSIGTVHQLDVVAAKQINKATKSSIGKVHQLGVVTAQQFNKALKLTVGQVHGLLSTITEQKHKAVLLEVLQGLKLEIAIAKQKNESVNNFVIQVHELDASIAEQFNQAIPGYLVSSLIEDIDPQKSVLISVTPESILVSNTPSSALH